MWHTWHASETRLIHVWSKTDAYVCHDSHVTVWLIICDSTHDSFMCDLIWYHVSQDSSMCDLTCVDMIHYVWCQTWMSQVKSHINVTHDRYTWLKSSTARSLEDETRNARRNANRNPEWWRNFSQLVKIEKLEFLGISRNKFELRFWSNLNSSVSRGTNSNPDFSLMWSCNWLKSPHHSGFRFAFRRAFRVSSSRERAVSYMIWGGYY